MLGRPCLLDGECASSGGAVCGNPSHPRRPKGEEPKKCACKRHYHNFRNQECLPGQIVRGSEQSCVNSTKAGIVDC